MNALRIIRKSLLTNTLVLVVSLWALNAFCGETKVYSANGFQCTVSKNSTLCTGTPCYDTISIIYDSNESPDIGCSHATLKYETIYTPATGCLCVMFTHEQNKNKVTEMCRFRDEKTTYYFSDMAKLAEFCETGQVPTKFENKIVPDSAIENAKRYSSAMFDLLTRRKDRRQKMLFNYHEEQNKIEDSVSTVVKKGGLFTSEYTKKVKEECPENQQRLCKKFAEEMERDFSPLWLSK